MGPQGLADTGFRVFGPSWTLDFHGRCVIHVVGGQTGRSAKVETKISKTMGPLFGVLAFLSLVALVVGLIKPPYFNKVFKGNATRKKIGWTFGIATIVLFVIGVSITPTDNAPASTPSINQTAAAPAQTAVPETAQQKLDDAVKAQLQQTSMQVSYKDANIESDDSNKPKGSEYVTVDINTGETFNEDSFITGSGQLAAGIFQNVFPIDPNFYDVLVAFYGQTTDQYGNSTSSLLMSYVVDRPLYTKINWGGLATVQNDIHLCAFIREEFDTMPSAERANSYVGCTVLASNLRQAENAIEAGNPQYGDIPQYKL